MTPKKRRTRRTLALTTETRRALHAAAFHGFAEDGETDPPGLTPPREWIAALYEANRRQLVAEFRARPSSFLTAWPVANFDEDAELRRQAASAVARSRARMKALGQQVAAQEFFG